MGEGTGIEVEAKLSIPDDETFSRLLAARHIGPYVLEGTHTQHVEDSFLDTPTLAIVRARYALRLRQVAGEPLVATLKGLAPSGEGGLHRRQEYQTQLPDSALSTWPESELRDMVVRLSGGETLQRIAGLRQTRAVSSLRRDGRNVAEFSLDRVTMDTVAGRTVWLEAEAELRAEGDESDLASIIQALVSDYGLEPQPLSKFERALRLVQEGR